MSTPAVSCLREALRRSFVTLEKQRSVWRSVLAECSPLMDSLGNLAEQMSALSRVQLSDTPLRVFPELRERLRFKLLQAADSVLENMSCKMTGLQAVRDAISNQVSAILQLYEQNSDALDLLAVTERSATVPSVADMLEWLQDAERFYRQQFLQRKALLQTLRLDDLPLLESAPRRWKSLESPSSDQRIRDTLCKLSFFMESQ
ncbi:uncharacterized protein C1orf109 homolog [Kryptolebias marmoratus]|uniref:AFG2 interacting ribosome maturation factor n=1 Tax=Kryptolebias marmoratus TaxID=37003 RepID=A0A3Q3B707_KRYMA|nr:uncharacterized protein C1orf109 homolog [Kryptolebias marmoratus]